MGRANRGFKFKRKTIFIAHGTKDDIIPIRKAYRAQKMVRKSWRTSHSREAEIGHKLSAGCFNGLEDFFIRERFSDR